MVGASANTDFKSVLCFFVFLVNLNVLIYIYIYILSLIVLEPTRDREI